jgi:hypothetical protein
MALKVEVVRKTIKANANWLFNGSGRYGLTGWHDEFPHDE